MNEKNKELLEEVITDRLELVRDMEPGTEQEDKIFKEAMIAIDKSNDYEKIVSNNGIKVLEMASGVLIVPVMDYLAKRSFASMLCKFEKTDSFTTTPGRSLNSWFRWKK